MPDFNALLDIDHHLSGEVYETWRLMRRDGGVHWLGASDLPGFWSLSKHSVIKAVYGDPRRFSSAKGVLLRPTEQGMDPGAGLSLALTDPPRHRVLRAVMARHFGPEALHDIEDSIRERAGKLMRPLMEGDSIDFSRSVAARLTFEIICGIVGMPDETHEQAFQWSLDAYEKGTSLAANKEWLLLMSDLIDRRRTKPTGDLISVLLHWKDENGEKMLSFEEVILNCENMIGASENAGLSLAAGVSLFCDHPRQWQLLRSEPGLLRGAIEEVLRLASSARHSMRIATEDVGIGDEIVRCDDAVVLWLPSANRDEAVFQDPEGFDIGRKGTRHLALGSGEHACIGAVLARSEIRIVLELLQSLRKGIERSGPEIATRSLAVAGPVSLPIRLT